MTAVDNPTARLAELTTKIVVAYAGRNRLDRAELPALITSVAAGLRQGCMAATELETAKPSVPAVAIKKSVADDFVFCLEDGKKFKSLKRHLMTHHGLSPEAYREKWGLPGDYPMVAPRYAAARSALAHASGLGRKPRTAVPTETPEEPKEPVAKRRTPKKANQAA